MAFVFPSATMCCAYAGKAFNCLLLFTNEAAVATSFEAEARHLLLLIALFCCWANWFIYCVRLFWNNFMLICLLIVRLLHPSTPNTKDHPPPPPHPYECARVCVLAPFCLWLKGEAPMKCEVLAAFCVCPSTDCCCFVCFAAAFAATAVHWLLMSRGIRWFSATQPRIPSILSIPPINPIPDSRQRFVKAKQTHIREHHFLRPHLQPLLLSSPLHFVCCVHLTLAPFNF